MSLEGERHQELKQEYSWLNEIKFSYNFHKEMHLSLHLEHKLFRSSWSNLNNNSLLRVAITKRNNNLEVKLSPWSSFNLKFGYFDKRFFCYVNISNWGTGYETLPWKQWCCSLCWKGRDRAQCFVLTVHTTVEYLSRNVSIGQLLQHISKSIVVCARSRPKTLTKTYNKGVCQAS